MKHSAQRGQISLIVIGVVIMAVIAGVAGLALRGGGSGSVRASAADSFAVRRGSFDISIPVSGELAALRQIEIRNNLDSRAIITEIVPEGVFVNAGDVVLRLNDEDVRNRLREAQDRLNVAEAALISAQAKLDIQIKTREAELAKADLAIKLADLALKAWREGEAVTRQQELELAFETAKKDFERLKDRFDESQSLLDQKFISLDEYRRDEIAKMKAASDLKKAENELMVYQQYQFEQEKAKHESDLEQALSERDRVEQQNDAEVRSAQSDVDSKKFQLDSAKEKLTELQQQLAYCTVTAPSPGLVVYHSSTQQGMGGRNEGRPPMVGTELSRNEMVIILPDTSQMVAAVKVSEALVGQIRQGQRATVTCDAMPDRVLNGVVQSVGVLAESGGWRDPNRRDYTIRILLVDGTDMGLKPSMRCKANIYVGRVRDSLHVPIQAVSRIGSVSFVHVPQGHGYAERKVITGRSSELFIEISEGLEEGETVLLRQPSPDEVVSRIPIPKKDLEMQEEAESMPDAPMMGPGGPNGGGPSMGGMNGAAGPRPEGMRRGGGGGPGGPGGPGGGQRERDGGQRPSRDGGEADSSAGLPSGTPTSDSAKPTETPAATPTGN